MNIPVGNNSEILSCKVWKNKLGRTTLVRDNDTGRVLQIIDRTNGKIEVTLKSGPLLQIHEILGKPKKEAKTKWYFLYSEKLQAF